MERLSKTTDITFDKLPDLRKPSSRDSRPLRELPSLPGVTRTPSQGIPKLGRDINNYMPDDYGSVAMSDKHQSISKEISKGISYLDVVSRVRDLERKYIDLASNLDRRVQTFIEENPQKIIRHLRNIEDKESILWKESQQKQLTFQDGLDLLKDSLKSNNDGVNAVLNTLTRRLDESDFKMANIMRGLEGIHKHKALEGRLALSDKPFDQEQKFGTLEAEVRLLKEALNQERQKRDVFLQDIMQQYQEINNYIHQNENDILNKFRRHKEDVIEENKRTKEQQRKLEEMKLDKLLGDSEYMRSLIRQVEGKIEEEVNKRLKHEFENKNWMEQKIALLKQEIKTDEKELLENEKKFIHNIQESMNSLNQIVTNTREQLEANIASTQTLFSDNVKNLSKSIDILKNSVFSKLNVFDVTVKELDQRVGETQKSFHEHTILVNETMEKEFGRIEKVTLKFEDLMNETLKLQDEKLNLFEENNKIWKKNFEEKNLRILTEISNALKTMKGELNKEKLATVERFENVKEEVTSNQLANEKLFGQVNDRIKGVETQFEYRIDESFVKAAEQLRRAVDILNQDIDKMGKSTFDKSKRETQANVAIAEQKMKGYTDLEINKLKEELIQNNRQTVDVLRTEVSKDFQSVHLKLLDLQNQRSEDIKSSQNEMKYLHDRITEVKTESREGLKHLSDEIDGKIKLAYQNAKNHATERVKELREEMNQSFATQSEFVRSEIDLAKAQNRRLLNDLYEKIHNEMDTQRAEISHQFEQLLEEERKIRAAKDTEVINAVQSVKTMLLETINTKIESTQALARALVNEEAAERARAIEHFTTTFRKRLDALEKFFKELIATTVEEAKLELKELIRLVDIKVEEHRVWTIKQLNIIIKDIEEYALSQTVNQYREEIYSKITEKERAEHWRQIEEAFQVVGAKFEDMDLLKRDELEMLDRKLFEMEEKNHQDHEAIFARMEELNEERKQDIEEAVEQIEDQEKAIKELEKNVEEIQANIYTMDDKFTNGIDDINIKLQVKDYVESLYGKIQQKQSRADEDELKREIKKKFKKIDEQMVLIDERFDEDEKTLELFEQKTENNFKIAEKALLAHRDFINNVDSRLTVEEMYAQIIPKNLEEKFALQLATVNTQVDLVNEDLDARFTKRLEGYQKRLEEDFIQHHILTLEDKLKTVKQEMEASDNKSKDFYQQRISEHEIKLGQHDEALQKFTESLAQNNETFEKIKLELMSNFEEKNKEDRENNQRTFDSIARRLDQLQNEGFGDEIKENIRQMIMKDVQKIMDNDIQSVMEKNMQILIEKDITKLIERETKKTVKENIDVELDPYNTRLTEIDNHVKDLQANTGKGPASGRSGAQDDEIKKELEKFKTLIDKIQKELIDKDKTNSDIERKIENINSNITGIEKTVKGEIDKTFNNQNENHKAVTNQLTKLFDQFQTLQNKIDK